MPLSLEHSPRDPIEHVRLMLYLVRRYKPLKESASRIRNMAGKVEQAQRDLHGVIAAIALARFLLANGCDGLNVLGTTGEATSFSLDQRRRVMNAYAEGGLPLTRM